MIILEGGNIFKGADKQPLTQRIKREDIPATVAWLEKVSGLPFPTTTWLGSTGKKATSGDLDLQVDANTTDKDTLVQILLAAGVAKTDIKKSGDSVHVKAPIAGDPANGFAQADLMFTDDPAWQSFAMAGSGEGSVLPGMARHIILSSIVAELQPNLKWSYKNGLVFRDTNQPYENGKSPATLSKVTGIPVAKLNSADDIVAAIKGASNYEQLIGRARETLEKSDIQLPESAPLPGTGAWFNSMAESSKFGFVKSLTESTKGRTPHPEDAIFSGSAAAQQQIAGLGAVVSNPNKLTIKWDGFPALIFGRDPADGRLAVMDKYMWNKGILAKSVDEWKQYDSTKASGGLRGDLYNKLAQIWPGLDAATEGAGFYWGDLLYTGQLQPQGGSYNFKPNTVEYRIPVNSNLGKLVGNSTGGIVVHQHFNELGGSSTQWDGKGLKNVPGGTAILTPSAGLRFELKQPVQLEKRATAALQQHGKAVDDLLAQIPASTVQQIQRYFNQFVTGQTKQPLYTWLEGNTSAKQYQNLVGDDYSGLLFAKDAQGKTVASPGYDGLNTIFSAILQYKQNLHDQLDSQIEGFGQFVNNQPAGEGFVFPTPQGLVKIVDRAGFSAANFAK